MESKKSVHGHDDDFYKVINLLISRQSPFTPGP
jgi:hypothetical protein